MDRASAERYHLIAQQRAAQFKTIRQEASFTRARSQDGQPVTYKKVKEKANISRRSRVMSDPEIPGTLVILNAKGLFQGKNGNYNAHNRPASSSACVNTMDTEFSRPQFFDPSLRSKEAKVSDLRKKFEAVQHDIAGDKHGETGSDFLNPLHKVNQDLANSNNTAKRTVKKKSEEALGPNNVPTTTQSTSALKTNKSQTDSKPTKQPEVKIEVPTRPPPRLPSRDPLKRPRSETDPMPLGDSRLSRVHIFEQECAIEEVVEEGSIQQKLETENIANVKNCNSAGDDDDGYDNDDDDDFDTDEWGSDFDDDDDEEDDEQHKRDSQSSHDSSGEAEPLVSFCLTLNL